MSCPTNLTVDSDSSILEQSVQESTLTISPTLLEVSVEQESTEITPLSVNTEISLPIQEVTIETKCSQGPTGPTGPQGEQGDQGLPGTSTDTDYSLLLVAENKIVSTLDMTLYSGVTWIVTCRSDTSSDIRMFTISATASLSSCSYILHSIGGSKYGVAVDVTLAASTLSLSLQNNHTEDLHINILNLKINRN